MTQMIEFFTDPLRLGLLIGGAIAVFGVIIYSRMTPRSDLPVKHGPVTEIDTKRVYDVLYKDPEINEWLDAVVKVQEVSEHGAEDTTPAIGSTPVSIAPDQERRFVVLHVAAPEDVIFRSRDVLAALREAGLTFGEHKIFHYPALRKKGVPPEFSVANMVKPGFLDIHARPDFTTPGLSFFMSVPGPIETKMAFAHMLEAAEKITAKLGGELLDGDKKPLTEASLQRIHTGF